MNVLVEIGRTEEGYLVAILDAPYNYPECYYAGFVIAGSPANENPTLFHHTMEEAVKAGEKFLRCANMAVIHQKLQTRLLIQEWRNERQKDKI